MAKKATLEEQFGDLQALATETKGLVFTNTFSKKNGKWGFYVFSTKKKIEDVSLTKALAQTIKYISENREKTEEGFKMK